MTTTELYSGLSEGKPSSRVSNPPGGRSNNIFGSDEPPAPKPQAKVPQQPAEGQTGGADADTPAPTHEIYTRNRPKKQASAFNPITHEDYPNGEEPDIAVTSQRPAAHVMSDKDYGRRDKARASDFNLITHEVAQSDQAEPDLVAPPARARIVSFDSDVGRRDEARAQAYNPITGEEIPADRSRNSSPKVAPTPASTPSQDHSTAAPTTTPNSATSPPPSIPTSDPTTTASPSRKIHTSSKVLKPPGGGSSGPLW